MIIGYARVSTVDQNLDMQVDALNQIGIDKLYTDKASGVRTDRTGFKGCLDALRSGDTLAVYKLDRIGRSLKDLINVISDLTTRNITIVSVKDSIDTSTASGKLMLNMLCVLSDYERTLIKERVQAGLEAARARGRLGGRPVKLSASDRKAMKVLYDSKELTVDEICKQYKISKPTFYRSIDRV
jgi:DNA invertase Pin-like site-specific DNA recombinase